MEKQCALVNTYTDSIRVLRTYLLVEQAYRPGTSTTNIFVGRASSPSGKINAATSEKDRFNSARREEPTRPFSSTPSGDLSRFPPESLAIYSAFSYSSVDIFLYQYAGWPRRSCGTSHRGAIKHATYTTQPDIIRTYPEQNFLLYFSILS